MCKSMLIFAFIFSNISIIAQDNVYKDRMKNQLNFIVEYSKSNNLMGKAFKSYDEVDQRILNIQNAWKDHLNTNDSVLIRFDGYPLLVVANIAGAEDKYQKYIFKKYTTTNIIADLTLINTSKSFLELHLLNIPTYGNVIDFMLITQLNTKVWNELYTNIIRLNSNIDESLKKHQFEKKFCSELNSIKSEINYYAKPMEFIDAIYNDNLETAYEQLTCNFFKDIYRKQILVLASRLLSDKFVEKDRTNEAFKTLELLLTNTIEEEVSRDSIKQWFVELDEEVGLQKFQSANKNSSDSILFKSNQQFNLTQNYKNLTDEKIYDLTQTKKKTVIIDFWATWCTVCVNEIPELRAFFQEIKSNKNVVFLSVITDAVTNGSNEGNIKELIKEKSITYPVLYDQKANSLAEYLNVPKYPAKYIIDKDGYLLVREKNDNSVDLQIIKAYIESVN